MSIAVLSGTVLCLVGHRRYQIHGTLSPARDNVVIVCHALTGNAAITNWWGAMVGPGTPHAPLPPSTSPAGFPSGSKNQTKALHPN